MSEQQQPAPDVGPGAPAGWYPHPTMAGTQAYWDGQAWTDHVAPAQTPPAAGGATQAASSVFLLLVAVAVVVLMIVVAAALVRG